MSSLSKARRRPRAAYLLPLLALAGFTAGVDGGLETFAYRLLTCKAYYHWRDRTDQLPPASDTDPRCQSTSLNGLTTQVLVVYAIMQSLLAVLFLNVQADILSRWGRKPTLLVWQTAAFLQACLMSIALRFGGSAMPALVLACWILSAIAHELAVLNIAKTYVADVVPEAGRSSAMSMGNGALFGGWAIGMGLGGTVSDRFGGLHVSYFMSACIGMLNIVYVALFFPESLTDERQAALREGARATTETRAASEGFAGAIQHRFAQFVAFLSARWNAIKPSSGSTLNEQRCYTLLLIAVGLCLLRIGSTFPLSILVLELSGKDWRWSASEIGYFVGSIGATRAAFLFFVFPVLARAGHYYIEKRVRTIRRDTAVSDPARDVASERTSLLHHSSPGNLAGDALLSTSTTEQVASRQFDQLAVTLSFALETMGMIWFAYAPNKTSVILAGQLVALGGSGLPSLYSIATSVAKPELTDQVLSSLHTFEFVGIVLSPILTGMIYSATREVYKPAVFIAAAGLLALGNACFASMRVNKKDWWRAS